MTTFDPASSRYDAVFSPLPAAYVKLIRRTLSLTNGARVLDLGCGTGRLTIPLTRLVSHVEGLDISERMLHIARHRDAGHVVTWHHASVEDFEFQRDWYSLIISFESFHLFPNARDVAARCVDAITADGYLAIGWVNYEWEADLQRDVVAAYAEFGVDWGEWGYQEFRPFAQIAEATGRLSPVAKVCVETPASTQVDQICELVMSVDKSLRLPPELQRELSKALQSRLRGRIPTGRTTGHATYWLAYCRRL